MPALVAGIHALLAVRKAWMAGTRPAMTTTGDDRWCPSRIEPHVAEIGAEVVAGRHLPAHHHLVARHDAVPPQERLLIRLLEEPLFEGADQRLALLGVALAQ